jgi:hypothetical protein
MEDIPVIAQMRNQRLQYASPFVEMQAGVIQTMPF